MPGRLLFAQLTVAEQPALVPAIAFASGLALGRVAVLWPGIVCLALAAAWFLSLFSLNWKWGRLSTGVILTSFVIGGSALGTLSKWEDQHSPIREFVDLEVGRERKSVELEGVLDSSPELAPSRIYLPLKVERMSDSVIERAIESRVRLVIYFNGNADYRDYDTLDLRFQDRIRARVRLKSAVAFRNPGSPDFSEILVYSGYDAIGVVASPHDIKKLRARSWRGVRGSLFAIRAHAIRRLLEGVPQPTSGILIASLFGNRYFIDHRAGRLFREGGTFHLIVISGMHIALIATALIRLSRLVFSSSLVRFTTVIAAMWAYTVMVGAEPAVSRAAVMVTLSVLGLWIHRSARGPNGLAVSGLLLLIWQPRDISNPSFQLSFLTVAVITMISAPLYLRMREIGAWRPSERTPHPPYVSASVRFISEVLFWNARTVNRRARKTRVRFKLEKCRTSELVSRLRIQPFITSIFTTLLVTTAVQISLLPLMIIYFHRVSLVSPIANVLEAALLTLLMALACIYLIASGFSVTAGLILSRMVTMAGALLSEVGHRLSDTFPSSVRVPELRGATAIAYAAFFGVLTILTFRLNQYNPFVAKRTSTRAGVVVRCMGRISTYTILFTLVAIIVVSPGPKSSNGRLSVTFLDVGQGDSSLIRFPRGSTMLIDAGGRAAFRPSLDGGSDHVAQFIEDTPGIGEIAIAPFLWYHGLKSIDYILATHGDSDHVQGFSDLVESFRIGEALAASRHIQPDPFPKEVTSARIPRRDLESGESLAIDGVLIEVVSPLRDFKAPEMSENNRSVVLRVSFGKRSFLMTGDIERKTEERLVFSSLLTHSDVLKVPHHGSKSSSTDVFLSRVLPCFAIISSGRDNRFGHPHDEVIARLNKTGAEILRTTSCGAITISTNGTDLKCETFVPCR